MLYFEDLQIGTTMVFGPHELLEEDIIAFAKKWGPRPFHIDPGVAAPTPMTGITASITHMNALTGLLCTMGDPIAYLGGLTAELELLEAARPGDILSLTETCLDRRLSKSKPDRGLVTIEDVLTNQAGKILMRMRSLNLVHCRPSSLQF